MNSDFTPNDNAPVSGNTFGNISGSTKKLAVRVFFGAIIVGIIIGYLYLEWSKDRNWEKFADCTVLSEDLVLCEGAFCNPSTEICNYLFPEE